MRRRQMLWFWGVRLGGFVTLWAPRFWTT